MIVKRVKRTDTKIHAKKLLKRENNRRLKEWKEQSKDRDNHKCVMCGTDKMIQSHHILSYKMYPDYRYDLDNAICLCPKHHKYGSVAVHINPMPLIKWMEVNRPQQLQLWRERTT